LKLIAHILFPRIFLTNQKKNINEPKYLPHIANEIAELKEIEIETLKIATQENAIKFFS
jgi:TatD DNase family protein